MRDQTAQLRKDLERENNARPNDEQTDGRSRRRSERSERDEMPCYKMDARPRGNDKSYVHSWDKSLKLIR